MITYYVAASSDGFIAGKGQDLSFLDMAEGDHDYDYGYEALYKSIDICVWGKGTYDSGYESQVDLRDDEIVASGNDCP